MKRQPEVSSPLDVTQAATIDAPFKRWLLPLGIVVAGLIGLISFAPKTAQAPHVRAVALPDENKALVQRVYADLGTTPDLELVAQLFAPNFQYHLLDGSATVHGPEGRKTFESIYWSVDLHRHHIIETLVPVGEEVVTRWTTSSFNYHHMGEPFTASSDEAQSVSGTTIWRLGIEKSPKSG
jgi:hypothetical protein